MVGNNRQKSETHVWNKIKNLQKRTNLNHFSCSYCKEIVKVKKCEQKYASHPSSEQFNLPTVLFSSLVYVPAIISIHSFCLINVLPVYTIVYLSKQSLNSSLFHTQFGMKIKKISTYHINSPRMRNGGLCP